MKFICMLALGLGLLSFSPSTEIPVVTNETVLETNFASFSLVNDTKEKVQIHTGSGFVSLNKGSKTSITCNTGKEVRWANKGKKGSVIFKISSDHCGKTIKLSKFLEVVVLEFCAWRYIKTVSYCEEEVVAVIQSLRISMSKEINQTKLTKVEATSARDFNLTLRI